MTKEQQIAALKQQMFPALLRLAIAAKRFFASEPGPAEDVAVRELADAMTAVADRLDAL